MAMKAEEIEKTFLEAIGKVETHGKDITEKTMKKEGTDDIDDFIQSMGNDMLSKTTGGIFETLAPTNFFPTRLDPKIYDNGTLFRRTPLLTYLEALVNLFSEGHLGVVHDLRSACT